MRTILVGIAGGSCAGKTTLASEVAKRLVPLPVRAIQFDSYYRDLSHLPMPERHHQNFDCLEILEWELLRDHLQALHAGKTIDVPVYDYRIHNRSGEVRAVSPAPIVMVEGILLFAVPSLTELLDLKVFLDAEADVRLARRIERDIRERGRTAATVIAQYLKTVQPMHDQLVEPSKKAADLVVYRGGLDEEAIGKVGGEIKRLLEVTK
jgi:uridine kinase